MFAVIYRGYVKVGFDERYRECWKNVAAYFVKERGALGSTLHKTEDGMWVAYSKWPNKEARDASWPKDEESTNADIPVEIREAIEELKKCLDENCQFPEIAMEITEEIP